MANDLVLIETKIKEGDAALDAADKHAGKAVEMKIAAGLLYDDAARMCDAVGLTFKVECKRITSRSYSQVCKVRQIAKAPDPAAEHKRQMSAQNEYNKRSVSNIRDQDLGEWVGIPKMKEPPAIVPVWERQLVKDYLANWYGFTDDERAYMLPILNTPMKKFG